MYFDKEFIIVSKLPGKSESKTVWKNIFELSVKIVQYGDISHVLPGAFFEPVPYLGIYIYFVIYILIYTVCPRNSEPIHTVTYYTKMGSPVPGQTAFTP